MPDAPGLELVRAEINERHPDAVTGTSFDHGQATLVADPEQVLDILAWLRDTPGQEYRFLSSLHVADYLPAEPRFGVHYELLNRDRVERIRVKALLADPAAQGEAGSADSRLRLDRASAGPSLIPPARAGSEQLPVDGGSEEAAGSDSLPVIPSCVELFPTADFQEREAYDLFGIVFSDHPDLRRILMPEDYVGWPLRRDFPVGGEPVLFTRDEVSGPR